MNRFYRGMAFVLLMPALALAEGESVAPAAQPEVSFKGELVLVRQRFPVELKLACLGGGHKLRLEMALPAGLKWDPKPFEGPGGLGERRKLQLKLEGLRKVEEQHFAGWYATASQFVIGWESDGKLLTLAQPPHMALLLQVDGATRRQGQLQARFPLPDRAGWQPTLAPCLSAG